MKALTQKQTIVVAITILIAAAAPSLSYADKPSTPVSVVNDATNPVPAIVVNPTNKPVLVRSVDSGAMQPFSIRTNVTYFGNAGAAGVDIYTVPSGKRLVIEYISFDTFLTQGQDVAKTVVTIAQTPTTPTAFLIAIPNHTGFGGAWQSSQLVKGYVEAGGLVSAAVVWNSGNSSMSSAISVTGYLVDVP